MSQENPDISGLAHQTQTTTRTIYYGNIRQGNGSQCDILV